MRASAAARACASALACALAWSDSAFAFSACALAWSDSAFAFSACALACSDSALAFSVWALASSDSVWAFAAISSAFARLRDGRVIADDLVRLRVEAGQTIDPRAWVLNDTQPEVERARARSVHQRLAESFHSHLGHGDRRSTPIGARAYSPCERLRSHRWARRRGGNIRAAPRSLL